MQRIIYLSSSRDPMPDADIAALLAVSRRNNTAAGITGLLLYHEQSFLQVLEGEEPALSACFGRIAQDPRHRNLIMLWRDAVNTRAFGAWQMGFSRVRALVAEGVGGVISLQDLFTTPALAPADPVVEKLVQVYLRGFPDISGPMVVPR